MLRYALYARKSKDDKSGMIKSIEDQKKIWQELADRQGLLVARVYEENKTAKLPGVRPVYRQMVADLSAGRVDGVLVWHVNRLARNMQEAGFLAQMLIDGKIKEIRTPHWTYRPGDNILPLLLEQGMSAQYSLDLSEAVKRGMRSMAEAGGWPHRAKVGYLNARDPVNPKRGIVVRDPERFDLLRKGFDLMLTGSYAVREAVDIMNKDWGFTTKALPSRPAGPLSYAAAYDIFTSPFYAGFIVHRGELRKGLHEPMITVAELHRLQGMIRRRDGRGTGRRRRDYDFAYTGTIRCGRCGMGVTAERQRRPRTGREYVYYHCSDPYLRCTKHGMSEAAVEERLVAELERVTLPEEMAATVKEDLVRWLDEYGLVRADMENGREAEIAGLERQRRTLLDLMLTGTLTDAEAYREKDAELLGRINELRVLAGAERERTEHIRNQVSAGLEFMAHARTQFYVAAPAARRQIVRALCADCVLRGNELTVTVDPLLEALLLVSKQSATSGPKLEPRFVSYQSANTSLSATSCRDGRDSQIQFELLKSICGLAWEHQAEYR